MRYDTACLLSAVLKGVKAKGHKVRGIGDAYHPKNPAFLAQFVIVKGVCGGHVFVQQAGAPNP
jgi:hypothetical protein